MSRSGDMLVRAFTGGAFGQNGYLVSCLGSGTAILVDPGAAVGEIAYANAWKQPYKG